MNQLATLFIDLCIFLSQRLANDVHDFIFYVISDWYMIIATWKIHQYFLLFYALCFFSFFSVERTELGNQKKLTIIYIIQLIHLDPLIIYS